MDLKSLLKRAWKQSALTPTIATLLRSIPNFPESIWKHLAFEGAFEVELPDQTPLKLWHGGHRVENEIFWAGIFGRWEKFSLQLWHNECKKATTILDAGANSGVYAALAAHTNKEADVIAVEPLSTALKQLRKNIELNNLDLEVFEGVLSDHIGAMELHLSDAEFQYSASLNSDFLTGFTRTLNVAAITVDQLVKQRTLSYPDLMKIDVEGHETALLAGMPETLRKSKPKMLIEVLEQSALDDIVGIVEPFGYKYRFIDEEVGFVSQMPADPHSRNVWFE